MLHVRLAPVLLATLALVATPALAGLPVNPILNGSFELAAPAVRGAVCAAHPQPVGTYPSDLATFARPVDAFAGTHVEDEVRSEALVTVWPCEQGAIKAAMWSSSPAVNVRDADGNGENEAVFAPGASAYLYQSYVSIQQLFSADFAAFAYSREAGTVPAGAIVQLALVRNEEKFVGPFFDCLLTLPSSAFRDESGRMSANPVLGSLTDAGNFCQPYASQWAGAAPSARHEILSHLRVVQSSFWGFSAGVTIDDVAILDSTLATGVGL